MQPEEILKSTEIFKCCTLSELEAVSLHAIRRSYAPYSVIVRQEDPSRGLFVLLQGSVKVVHHFEDGKELALAILHPYECVGEMSLIDGEPHSATIETLEKTEILILTQESFKKVIEQVPTVSFGIMKSLSQRLRKSNTQLADMAFLSIPGRLAKKLVEMHQNHSIELTHKELASLIGANRENVSRALKNFEQLGYIRIQRSKIEILNLDSLKSAASIH